MRLTDLSPEWEFDHTYLTFNCPKCEHFDSESRYAHKNCLIMIPTKQTADGGKPWGWNGETDFEKVTLTPSIFHHCKSEAHFFITDGAIILV